MPDVKLQGQSPQWEEEEVLHTNINSCMFSTLNKLMKALAKRPLLHPSTKWATNMLFSFMFWGHYVYVDGYYHTTLLEIKEKCKQLSSWLQRCSFFLLVKRTTDNLDKRAAEATKAEASILQKKSFFSFNALVVLASFSRPLSIWTCCHNQWFGWFWEEISNPNNAYIPSNFYRM